jgi:hypothetical protein
MMHLTPETEARFLELLRSGYSVALACASIGTTLDKIARRRTRLPSFNEAVKAALQVADQRLRRVLDQRRTRAILARLDQQATRRQIDREKQLAEAQRRTAQTVARCSALERAVASGTLNTAEISARVVASLLMNGSTSNGTSNGRRKRA